MQRWISRHVRGEGRHVRIEGRHVRIEGRHVRIERRDGRIEERHVIIEGSRLDLLTNDLQVVEPLSIDTDDDRSRRRSRR